MKQSTKSLIFAGLSLVGIVGTTALAVKSGMDTQKTLTESPAEDVKDAIKKTWKHYVWTVGAMIATGTCVLTSNSLSAKQVAGLSSVAAAGATTFSRYRSKIREIIGVEEEKQVYDAVKCEESWFISPYLPMAEGLANDVLFHDQLSDRYFYANNPRVMQAIYHFNRAFACNGIVYPELWFEFLGLDNDPKLDNKCWHVDFFWEDGLWPWIDIQTWKGKTPDGQDCIEIGFDWDPVDIPEEYI